MTPPAERHCVQRREGRLAFEYDREADILYISNWPAYAGQETEELGDDVVALAEAGDPDAIDITVSIDGQSDQQVSTAGMLRPAARLLADVTEFMTLSPGDLLLLGVRAGAPRAGAGQRFAVEAAGIGRLEGALA